MSRCSVGDASVCMPVCRYLGVPVCRSMQVYSMHACIHGSSYKSSLSKNLYERPTA